MKTLERQLAEYGDYQRQLHRPISPDEVQSPAALKPQPRKRLWRGPVLAAVVAALLLIAGLIPALLRDDATPAVNTTPTTPTTTVGLSGDVPLLWVVYWVHLPHTGSYDIRIVGPGGAARSLLGTPDDGIWRMCPRFSPTGDQLAYVRTAVGGDGGAPSQNWVLVLADFDAGTGRISSEVEFPIRSGYPDCGAWSPDGSQYAYASPSGTVSLLEAGGLEPVELEEEVGTHIAWSPNGTELASIVTDGVLITSIDGRQERLILARGDHTYDWLRSVSWSPDGQSLAVDGIQYGGLEDATVAPNDKEFIWIVDAQGVVVEEWTIERTGGVGPLGPDGATLVMGPVWSPTGDKIAYATSITEWTEDCCNWQTDPFVHRITVQDLVNHTETVIDPGDSLEGAGLEWTDDGEWLLVVARDSLTVFSSLPPHTSVTITDTLGTGPRAEALMEAERGMSSAPAPGK